MASPQPNPAPSSKSFEFGAELDNMTTFHAGYLAKLFKHEERLEAAKDKADSLAQQWNNLDPTQEAPDVQPPAGLGSITARDRIVAEAYALTNETRGEIPTATRALRAYLDKVRVDFKQFDGVPSDPSAPDAMFTKNVLRNIKGSFDAMEEKAARMDRLGRYLRDITHC